MTVIIIEINYVRANTREYGHVGVLIDSYNELEACNFIIPLQSTGMCASNLSISIPTNANTNTNTNLDRGESKFAAAIHLALEVVVELPDGIHNPEEELSAHPIMAPKCFLAVKWSIGEVVE